MARKQIITIAGKPGSGKSSTAREAAKILGFKHFSAGKMVRKIAQENNVSLEELNLQALKSPDVDHKIDRYLKQLARKEKIVIDSRLGFYWIPDSFKVYLELDSDIAAARIYRDIEKRERRGEHMNTIEQVWERVQQRTHDERARFKKLYSVDPFDTDHYDLIVRTERNNPLTAALWIHDQYLLWLNSNRWTQVIEEVPLGYSEK